MKKIRNKYLYLGILLICLLISLTGCSNYKDLSTVNNNENPVITIEKNSGKEMAITIADKNSDVVLEKESSKEIEVVNKKTSVPAIEEIKADENSKTINSKPAEINNIVEIVEQPKNEYVEEETENNEILETIPIDLDAEFIQENISQNIVQEQENKTNEDVQPIGHYEEQQVLVEEAWDEQVLVQEAKCEQVCVQKAYKETWTEYEGRGCYSTNGIKNEGPCYMIHHVIPHEAVYEEVCTPDIYETIHHDAVYKTETVWVEW